jgi:hypothetical protein
MLSPGCSPPRRTSECANHEAPKSWHAGAARRPNTLIRAFSIRWPRPMLIKISSTGPQKQHHKLLLTLPGSAKQRWPAKSQGDLSYIKRAGLICPSGVNWTTSFARCGRIPLGLQPATSLTASLASPATERSAASYIQSRPQCEEKDGPFRFHAGSHWNRTFAVVYKCDFRVHSHVATPSNS